MKKLRTTTMLKAEMSPGTMSDQYESSSPSDLTSR